jgi:hypothetical protein
MTYADPGFQEQWEYKVVFARNGEFAFAEHIRRLMEQEAPDGWVLIEKYNDTHIRLGRPISRAWQISLPRRADPYRTRYTLPPEDLLVRFLFYAFCAVVMVTLVVMLIIFSTFPAAIL